MTVRRIVQGEGVERVFPLHNPRVKDIVVTRRGDVRRAKLYYLRDRVGKKTRVKELLGEKVRRDRVARPSAPGASPSRPGPVPPMPRGRLAAEGVEEEAASNRRVGVHASLAEIPTSSPRAR